MKSSTRTAEQLKGDEIKKKKEAGLPFDSCARFTSGQEGLKRPDTCFVDTFVTLGRAGIAFLRQVLGRNSRHKRG